MELKNLGLVMLLMGEVLIVMLPGLQNYNVKLPLKFELIIKWKQWRQSAW